MKIITAIILLILITVLFVGCPNNQSKHSENSDVTESVQQVDYKKISAEEARRMMEEQTDYILLDVRTEEEFAEIRIDGAILIPDYEIKDRAADELPDKTALILIYCRSGRRSANVAHELIDMGYTDVYDFGGIIDWPYTTVSG